MDYKEQPVQIERYGRVVWELPTHDGDRREHCLCLNCRTFKPDMDGHCKIAARLYDACKEFGLALFVTRCEGWTTKEEKH